MGARLNATSEGFGATARTWWANRLGLQFDVMHARTEDISAGSHVNSLQVSPSLLYSLPDGVASALWVRPYVGGGGIIHRASVSQSTSGTSDSPARQGLGLQGFGGIEATIRNAADRDWDVVLIEDASALYWQAGSLKGMAGGLTTIMSVAELRSALEIG